MDPHGFPYRWHLKDEWYFKDGFHPRDGGSWGGWEIVDDWLEAESPGGPGYTFAVYFMKQDPPHKRDFMFETKVIPVHENYNIINVQLLTRDNRQVQHEIGSGFRGGQSTFWATGTNPPNPMGFTITYGETYILRSGVSRGIGFAYLKWVEGDVEVYAKGSTKVPEYKMCDLWAEPHFGLDCGKARFEYIKIWEPDYVPPYVRDVADVTYVSESYAAGKLTVNLQNVESASRFQVLCGEMGKPSSIQNGRPITYIHNSEYPDLSYFRVKPYGSPVKIEW